MGIMLPALSATSLLLVATMLAGKLPVMLNWTVGSASFEHCMKFAQLDTILTSKAFYAKLSSPWLAQFESKMLFIEDILATITPVQKITGLIKKFFWMIPSESEGAVMLFTS
jgi:long-chain-fatty-acid--[acyl-carrier-protein] ligase